MSSACETVERWAPVLLGRYEVSTLGRVRAAWAKRGRRALKSTPDKDGYAQVGLRIDGVRKWFRVSALVLTAFVSARPKGHEAAHIDGDNANDVLFNLAWKTTLENHADKQRHGTTARGERHGRAKLTASEVTRIKLAVAGGSTQRAVGKEFSIGKTTVAHIVRGDTWRNES